MLWNAVVIVILYSPPATTLDDLGRFPNHHACFSALDFNRDHLKWLNLQPGWAKSHEHVTLLFWKEETEALGWAWHFLAMARDGSNPEHYRLSNLEALREMLGEDAWAAGQMPPPVPLSRFRAVR